MMEKLLRSSLVVMVQILESGLQLSTSLLLFSMKRMWQWVRRENYVLAVIKTTETYDNLRDNLADLQMEMSNLKEISANNCTYKIEYFFGRDLKF